MYNLDTACTFSITQVQTIGVLDSLLAVAKNLIVEKVDIEFQDFRIILTTPEGDVKDLTNLDDCSTNWWYDSPFALLPDCPTERGRGHLNPIWTGIWKNHCDDRTLAAINNSRTDRKCGGNYGSVEEMLKAEEKERMGTVKWALHRCSKKVKKLASVKELRRRVLPFTIPAHKKYRY